MKFTKRGAKVGVMVRWKTTMTGVVFHYGIITQLPEVDSYRPAYQVRECTDDSRVWYLQSDRFTIHKA